MEASQLIRAPSVAAILSVSRSTVWRWSKFKPEFPRPIKISTGVTVWKLSEIQEWLEGRDQGGSKMKQE